MQPTSAPGMFRSAASAEKWETSARERPLDDWTPAEVGAALLHHLTAPAEPEACRFRHEPEPVEDGWETYIYRFQLEPSPLLAADFHGPLILRVFSSRHGIARARREFAVLCRLHELDFPVGRPVYFAETCAPFGGPFMLIEQVPGPTLYHHLLARPWLIVPIPIWMAELQYRLHELPTDRFPPPETPLLARSLAEMSRLIVQYHQPDLEAGWQWLDTHRPAEPDNPSILHLDFHPRNIICGPGRALTVVDWLTADWGDRHADVATTLLILETGPVTETSYLEALAAPLGRWCFRRWYRKAYERRQALDPARLRYYLAWAALRRLVHYARCFGAGPEITGAKPSLRKHLTRAHVQTLEDLFAREAGVAVRLRAPLLDDEPEA